MSVVIAQLDKVLNTSLNEGHGTITIRVVVLAKQAAAASIAGDAENTPTDAAPDEVLPDTDKRPFSTFLEEPKRGRQCCVFLINGQRQHAWDNQFLVRDLDLKYLRNRMLVIVDCDGLKPEAIAELMQGSRHQFYEGTVYSAVESRVVATLKGDPDLRRLEEEAEDEISSLQAGDEAVKATLDQLIEAHHDAADHTDHGHVQGGAESRQQGEPGALSQTENVIVLGGSDLGTPSVTPVLNLRPDIATIRLKPNDVRRVTVYPTPDTAWKLLETMVVTFDPPVKELQVTRKLQISGEDVELKFAEPEDFDNDEYPIETVLRATAMFKGYPEPRSVERRVVVTPKKQSSYSRSPHSILRDDPTTINVTSRQPIKIVIGGPDVHVRLKWDGKDELLEGNPPSWALRVSCESPSVEPQTFLTRPVNGRFELLVQAAPGLKSGDELKFDVEAVGPGTTLTTAFTAGVVELPSARKVSQKVMGGSQRRPPYALMYIKKENWNEENCWGNTWSAAEPGSFEEPSTRSPLTIFVNQDMELLATYRESLLAKKQAEATIQQRINKYTAHVAFHLYQMFEKKQAKPNEGFEGPNEEQMRDEIQRVARTLIKLMEVSG